MFSINGFGQGSWEVLDAPTDQNLRSVFFTDSLYGWAVGDTGTIIHTQDGGETWILQDAGTQNNIMHVFFLDRNNGWATSWNFDGFYGTLVLNTTDGGNTWNSIPYLEDNIFMNCILFLDSLHGWMGGSPHALVRTSDGGQSWTQAAIDTNALAFFPVLNIYFFDDLHGYACGGMFDIAGVTWSTSDGGDHWIPIDPSDAPADEVHGMHMFGPLTVLGAGGDPDQGYGVGMLRTNNGGTDWDYEELSMAGNAFDIDFRNDTEAWAPLGPSEQLIYSMDAGITWTPVQSPESTAIFDMIFTDSLHGYAVGYDGAFLKYKAVGVSVGEEENSISQIKIFPNPADDHISIRIIYHDVAYLSRLNSKIWIYDPRMRLVMSRQLIEDEISLDVSGLPAGIYLVKVIVDNAPSRMFSKKLLIR